MKLQTDLREFIELLNSRRVEFVVVGGHAVAFHGNPRYTGDIDFLVGQDARNSERLADVLREFGFGEVAADTFTAADRVIQLGRPPNRIDLLTTISGVSFEEAWGSRVPAELDGLPVTFLGRDALLKNKRASGRPKDLADVDELERRG